MKFDKNQLAKICRQYGPFVKGLDASFDAPTLLWAISGCETSFGQNCVPRHEPEYCTQRAWHKQADGTFERRPGRYSMQNSAYIERERQWGCWAHSSYGPWQIMFSNAPGYAPDELYMDLEKAAEATVGFLSRRIAEVQPDTLYKIAELWNGAGMNPQYAIDLLDYYQAGLPPE